MSLRIAMVTETYPPEVNGVARTMKEMVEGLRARGHTIRLVRPRQSASDQPAVHEVLARGISIPRYPQLKMGLPAKQALVASWREFRPDLVHVATEGPLGWSALNAAEALGLPVASDFHTNFHTYSRHYGAAWLARPVAAYLRSFHNRCAYTMVPTRELADELAALGLRGLRVAGRGVHAQVFSPAKRSAELRSRWAASPDTPVVLCVSRFAPEKNFPLVVKAFQAMRAERADARLVLVGDGPMAAGLEKTNAGVVVAGRKDNGELSAHYASADIFLFPSTSETYGLVTLEAMASGLAIVAYRYAAAREHLRHGETALLPEVDDEAGFIGGARQLVEDLSYARALGAAARAQAERLSWSRAVDEFETVLFDALRGGKPAHAAA
ncbi:MAG: glycosyltransferase family 4 protein [Betaproteobacteria bacterium]